MNSARRFLYGMAITAGAAAAWIAPHAAADDADFLSGSTEALILGPTGIPDPGDGYVTAVDSLYLDPLGFDGTSTVLDTPETSNLGPSIAEGETILTNEVTSMYAAGDFSSSDPLTIFGYSQSAGIISLDEQTLANDGIPSADLHFVLVGDVSSAQGGLLDVLSETQLGQEIADVLGWQNIVGPTPDNLYPTDVYSLPDDGWANWDNGANILGMYTDHEAYLGLTPAEISSATEITDGLTNYFTIPQPNIIELIDALFTVSANVG